MHNALKPKRRLKFTPIDEKWQVAPFRFPEPTVVSLDVISHMCAERSLLRCRLGPHQPRHPQVGQLHVKIIGGSFSTPRPYIVRWR